MYFLGTLKGFEIWYYIYTKYYLLPTFMKHLFSNSRFISRRSSTLSFKNKFCYFMLLLYNISQWWRELRMYSNEDCFGSHILRWLMVINVMKFILSCGLIFCMLWSTIMVIQAMWIWIYCLFDHTPIKWQNICFNKIPWLIINDHF